MRTIILVIAVVAGMLANLVVGSVDIPLRDIWAIIMGDESVKASWRFIIMESRLPQLLTALLSGAALSVSGLMLQTAFRNPLAGPDVFGINSGAGLGVALVMLLLGGSVSAGMFTFTGFLAIMFSAFAGAMLVTSIIFG
ncbi:MAG: iron chelate uptake ABC transporter family permease subunit, partial [Prevotella sp.]|nr:iron chelate uptake ABC transporter family permease subunit [Prevotella sp.]